MTAGLGQSCSFEAVVVGATASGGRACPARRFLLAQAARPHSRGEVRARATSALRRAAVSRRRAVAFLGRRFSMPLTSIGQIYPVCGLVRIASR